jgi:hypothetical protein
MREVIFPKRQQSMVSAAAADVGRTTRRSWPAWRSRRYPRQRGFFGIKARRWSSWRIFLFEPKDPEMFCMRQKRVARDRVVRTKEILLRDLANPPTLEMLGQEVGCSPFYLSRIFSPRGRPDHPHSFYATNEWNVPPNFSAAAATM